MLNRYYNRDGVEIPEDWANTDKHGGKYTDSSSTDYRVAATDIGGVFVSTVWLGRDHGYGTSLPIIFETMIFGGEWNVECRRYHSELGAVRGHIEAVDRLHDGKPPFKHLDGN